MVDWAYVNGMGDDGGDPDHDIHDPQGHCESATSVRSLTAYGPDLRCNRCGDRDVYWQTVRGKYVLNDKSNLQPHTCPPPKDLLEGFD